MTKNKNFKQRVRMRAAKTGESYTAALQHIRQSDIPHPKRSICLAVAQTTLFDDPRDILGFRSTGREICRLMEEAKSQGARLIHFPEGATCSPSKWILSELGPDEVASADWRRVEWQVLREELEAIRRMAARLEIWTIFGSVHQLSAPHRPHNCLYVISDRGEIVTRYDERWLSNTKNSFMYSPGKSPTIFEVEGFRFGCALGMESHYPEIFTEYERLDVDCILFSTTGQITATSEAFAAEVLGHAASNSYWVSYSAHAPQSVKVPSAIAGPNGQWAVQCPKTGNPAVAVTNLVIDQKNYAKEWRRKARQDIYSERQIEDDPRSDHKNSF